MLKVQSQGQSPLAATIIKRQSRKHTKKTTTKCLSQKPKGLFISSIRYKINLIIVCTYRIMSSLRQFKCYNIKCNGNGQKYRVWHERVPNDNPTSKCRICGELRPAVPIGEEEGVKICHFTCGCGNTFVVRCKMSNTAPCYDCDEKQVAPHSFEKLRKIDRKTGNTHNCSECDGKGNCPNMRCRPEKSTQPEKNVPSEVNGLGIQCDHQRRG